VRKRLHRAKRIANVDLREEIQHPCPDIPARQRGVSPEHLDDLVTDRLQRVERRHRLLKDHADAGAANPAHLVPRQLQKIASFEADAARRSLYARRQKPHDRGGSHRFAGSGFAHDAKNLIGRNCQADVVQGILPVSPLGEPNRKLLD